MFYIFTIDEANRKPNLLGIDRNDSVSSFIAIIKEHSLAPTDDKLGFQSDFFDDYTGYLPEPPRLYSPINHQPEDDHIQPHSGMPISQQPGERFIEPPLLDIPINQHLKDHIQPLDILINIQPADTNAVANNSSEYNVFESNVSYGNVIAINPSIETNDENTQQNMMQFSNIAIDSKVIAFVNQPTEQACKRKSENDDDYNDNVKPSKAKRHRSCVTIDTKFRDGYKIKKVKNKEISREDKERYERLRKIEVNCSNCNKNVSIIKVLHVNGKFICMDCAKDLKISLDDIKYNLYEHVHKLAGGEEFDFHNHQLYRCERLHHAAPLCFFIKQEKDGSPIIVTNCLHCRNYKSQENNLKPKQKKNN